MQKTAISGFFRTGAGNEARTRDLDLGKVALYQLSYARIFVLTKLVLVSGARGRTRTGTTCGRGILNLVDLL